MENKMVSVVMACYNVERYVNEALRSIFCQTYTDWELILYLDGCSDRTESIIRQTIEPFGSKCKLIVSDENRGYGYSLKQCIDNGTGALVAIVDADDALATEDALEIMVNAHSDHPDASLIYSDYNECDKNLSIDGDRCGPKFCSDIPVGESLLGHFDLDGRYIGSDYIVSHLKVFKRSYYDMTVGLDPTLVKAVDRCISLLLEEVGALVHIPGHLYNHRQHEYSITGQYKYKLLQKQKEINDMKLMMYRAAYERRKV